MLEEACFHFTNVSQAHILHQVTQQAAGRHQGFHLIPFALLFIYAAHLLVHRNDAGFIQEGIGSINTILGIHQHLLGEQIMTEAMKGSGRGERNQAHTHTQVALLLVGETGNLRS